jgi:HSP20 family protein
MSWRYGNRKRQNRDEDEDNNQDSFSQDPFGFGFRTGFQDIDEMIEGMFRTVESMGPSSDSNGIFYGYQVNIGPDGKPHVREFGNAKPTRRGTFEVGSREPFVDVVANDKDQTLKVVAEMPGVQKEDIQLQATEDSLSIRATNSDRTYDTSVPLNAKVDPNSARASYRNGVLEVVLKMKEAPKPKGTNITVE